MLVLGLWSPRKEKKNGGWGNWGYVGIRGDTGGGGGGQFDPINSVVYRDPILMIGTLQALGRTVA